ncbi:hypothetical protein ABZW49_10220 [Nonomuraea wenchangensis]
MSDALWLGRWPWPTLISPPSPELVEEQPDTGHIPGLVDEAN